MLALGLPAMSQMKLSKTNELQTSPMLEIMLMIACCMAVLLVLALIIWRIVKFILVKTGKRPDDYFVMAVNAKETIQHMIWTRSGRYRKSEDRAETEREKKGYREHRELEW